MQLNDLLRTAVDAGASDLHVKAGSYPMMRVQSIETTTGTARDKMARTSLDSEITRFGE
jgi:Tfp pilus assembly pilus retraction ATPase PilT